MVTRSANNANAAAFKEKLSADAGGSVEEQLKLLAEVKHQPLVVPAGQWAEHFQ